MKKLLYLLAFLLPVIPAAPAAQMSAEVLAIMRHVDWKGKPSYGAGVDLGYDFNHYVTGHLRAVAYEDDHWGGTAVDSGSALIEGVLFRSGNYRLALSAIGGVERDFVGEDWGLRLGPRLKARLADNFWLIFEDQAIVYIHQRKSLEAAVSVLFTW